ILRLSAYSLLFQSDIPASVTIDEAIDLAREFGSDESYRFVNGVLDAVRKDV
ncbi:MAG: transcription antitermination factor NusB, partial [Spirochaetota bacterium]